MANKLTPPADIGFIGLGNMGAPMARALIGAGFRLFVLDAAADAVDRFAEENVCERPGSPGELAKNCAVVITMLPNDDIVREVILGKGGVADYLSPGSIVIDMSSSSPLGTRALAQELSNRDIALIDAPVSGGVVKAEQGALTIMAGGGADTVEYCRPLFEATGRMFHAGDTGAGHAMKALNNFMSAASLAVCAEAVIAGTRFGLDPERMIEIINASTGRSNSSEHKYPAFVLSRRFDSGFALGLMAKDLRMARELARDGDTPHELMDKVSSLWDRAEGQLGLSADNTEIIKYLEELAGDGGND